MPASLFLTNPISHRVLSTLLLKGLLPSFLLSCPHSYCHSFSLDPYLLYRLVSLVSLSSLNLIFSICHQSYVWKNNLTWHSLSQEIHWLPCDRTQTGMLRIPCPANPALCIAVTVLFFFSIPFFSFFLVHNHSLQFAICLCAFHSTFFCAWTSLLLFFTLRTNLKTSFKAQLQFHFYDSVPNSSE